MAAPTPTALGTPAGIPLRDGYRSTITFAANTTVSLWEKSLKPPGLDGGDPVDQTTMRNVAYRVMRPRQLKTLTEVTCTAAYDPNVENQLLTLVNVETTVTVRWADGSSIAFYGFLRSFEPNDMSEGNQPEASVSIVPTNWDPTNNVEAGPVITSVAGT